MNISSVVVNISLNIFLIIGLMIFVVSNREVDGKINRYFILYLAMVCLLIIFDMWDYYLNSLTRMSNWRYLTAGIGYILRVSAITEMNILLNNHKENTMVLWVPIIILAIFILTNPLTHWVFYLGENNYWHIGFLGYLPHIVAVICMGILVVEMFVQQKNYEYNVKVMLVFIVLINIVSMIVETVFCEKFFLSGTMLIGAIFYYSIINKQNEIVRTREQEQELADSKIAIMLSQIQPHFLYNSLNSIRYLCKKNPSKAQKAIEDFATYLRGNLDSLKRKTPVDFNVELEHIQIYLALEKMRFDEELEIVYDLQTLKFFVPTLTVQPLVENAVKYGISKKEGGGMLCIATRETSEYYIITVRDNGAGYNQNIVKDDGKSHTGIENVRARLWNMCKATLEINSEINVGTTAIIRIPKGENE